MREVETESVNSQPESPIAEPAVQSATENSHQVTLYLVMPAYNEAANIATTIAQWHPVTERVAAEGHVAKLLIANDGSKDDTYAIMQGLTAQYPNLVPLDKPNSGHGATVLHLYRHALEHGADYIFQTDSDGQTDPEQFYEMWRQRGDYDFQIGDRQASREDGFSRKVVTKTLRLVVWLMFGEWVQDANTPFRLMERDKLEKAMRMVPPDFFLANVALSAIATKWRYRIRFQPITFRPRQGGVNSINMRRIIGIGWKALGDFRRINANLKTAGPC